MKKILPTNIKPKLQRNLLGHTTMKKNKPLVMKKKEKEKENK